MSVVSCPYCSESQTVNNEHYPESKRYDHKCCECGEVFQLCVEVVYQCKTYCAPGKHNMKKEEAKLHFYCCTACDFSEVRR